MTDIFEPIGPGIWTHEAQYRLGALQIPHRVTVTRGADGGLVVHSPARPDEATRTALAELGRVVAIVWPSWWHDLFMREWMSAYPDALSWIAPDSRGAARGRTNAFVLEEGSTVSRDFASIYVDGIGVWLNEFVFLHVPSRTLIVADLVVNVSRDLPQPARTFFTLLGAYPAPRIPWFYRIISRERGRLQTAFDRILAWDFDSLVMGHGHVISRGAHAIFATAVERLMTR